MTSNIPEASGDRAHWKSPPLKDVSNHSRHVKSNNKNGNQGVTSRLPSLKPLEEASSKSSSLKKRVDKKELITNPRLKKASELFKISWALTKISQKNPLTPFNPSGGHANDVYITDFKSLDKTNLEKVYKKSMPAKDKKPAIKPNPQDPVILNIKDSEEISGKAVKPVKQEKPGSKTADAIKANVENLDIVFKPGIPAAIRANICYGLTQLFGQFENVIAPTKKGEASVVSRKDYNIKREIVYNPESDCTYLINEKYMQHQVIVKVTEDDWDGIEGTVENAEVNLIPVDGHPGFFQIKGLPQKKANEIDKDYSEDGSEIEDNSSGSDDEPLNDIYVMHISPSRIEQWANQDTLWNLVTLKDETYLVPQDKMIEISDDEVNKNNWVEDDFSYDFEASDSMNDLNELDEIGGSNESGESAPASNLPEKSEQKNINASDYSMNLSDFETDEYSSEAATKAFVKINGTNFQILIDNNDFKLLPVNGNYLFPEDVQDAYDLVLLDERQVLVPKSACVRYQVDTDNLVYDGKKFDVEEGEGDSTFLVSPSYKITIESDEKAFVKIDKESWLQDHIIHTKNHINFVERNNLDYTIRAKDNRLEVVGENISGMVQLKVENIFQNPKGSTKALDITKASAMRDEFYQRIDMHSFIVAFLAVILLRPQDGKIIDLKESNILFQALPNQKGEIDPLDSSCKLRPVIIDLDETMPAANDYTLDPEFVKHGEKTKIHAVRNGLMGFPQTEKKLEGDEKKLAVECLKTIIDKNVEVNEFLLSFLPQNEQKRIKEKMNMALENKENNFSPGKEETIAIEKQPGAFDKDHISAYNDVVHNLDRFLKENEKNDWSLGQLFFFVFPEYADQWKMLGNMDSVKKAMHIGADDPTKVLQ